MSKARGYPRRRDDPAWLAERQQFYQDLRARLRVLRLHLGLTEREMAARLDISVRAYRRREQSARRIPLQFLIRLVEEFDVSAAWLLTGHTEDLPRNDHRPLTPGMKPIPPTLRVVTPPSREGGSVSRKQKSIVLTDDRPEIVFVQWTVSVRSG
jgi:transcriptional regulator with XRE-family HTH domain